MTDPTCPHAWCADYGKPCLCPDCGHHREWPCCYADGWKACINRMSPDGCGCWDYTPKNEREDIDHDIATV